VIHRSQRNAHLAITYWEQIEAITSNANGLVVQPAEFFRVYAEDLMLEARTRLAAQYFQRSLDLQPSAEVRARLGNAWYHCGRSVEAVKAWTEALDEDENNQEARLGLADEALSRADISAALRWLEPITSERQLTQEAAYLLQRTYSLLGNEELADHWQQKVASLRRSEKLRTAFEARSQGNSR
jgi:tetratricopeptide (TPR) repeat protein